jgi:hypothetical protein
MTKVYITEVKLAEAEEEAEEETGRGTPPLLQTREQGSCHLQTTVEGEEDGEGTGQRLRRERWQFIGFFTNLHYLGLTCRTGGFQNHMGSIELVRYRIYDPKFMPEVLDYRDLIGDNSPVRLGPYTVLNQEALQNL